MAIMKRGANVSLTREVPGLHTIVVGAAADAGSEQALTDSLVLAAILCDRTGRAASDDDFVFFNQLTAAADSVRERAAGPGEDREQIEIALDDVPAAIERIVIVLYANDGPVRRRTLGQLSRCAVRVLNAAGNTELVRSEDFAPALHSETALALGEVYRHGADWKFKVVGQGYANGIAGVAADYGLHL